MKRILGDADLINSLQIPLEISETCRVSKAIAFVCVEKSNVINGLDYQGF